MLPWLSHLLQKGLHMPLTQSIPLPRSSSSTYKRASQRFPLRCIPLPTSLHAVPNLRRHFAPRICRWCSSTWKAARRDAAIRRLISIRRRIGPSLCLGLHRQPEPYTVTKHQIGAFYGTALERILRRAGVTQVFLTGVATTMGVEASARNASTMAITSCSSQDAMSDMSAENHQHAVATTFARIGEVTTTDEVLAKLAAR